MKLYVHSHPRSGTHYLMDVLDTNFGPVEWGGATANHRLPHTLDSQFAEEDAMHFYIWRNFLDVARSFTARAQTNINVPEFSDTPWGELYGKFHEISNGGFPKKKWPGWVPADQKSMTPYNWWKHHVHSWLEFAGTRTDVHVVTYEDLTGSFQPTMIDIAVYLDSDRTSFENVTKKSDGDPVREGGYNG